MNQQHDSTAPDEKATALLTIDHVRAAAARIAACEAFWFASKENIQTHGGMGFTWEVDCHLFYRRAKLLAVQAGAPKVWKEKLVRTLENKNAA